MGIMLVFSYYLGTAQTKTVPAVSAIKTVAPDGYILLDKYIPYDDNNIDMNTVVDFSATEYGLQLYFADGSGYYWER